MPSLSLKDKGHSLFVHNQFLHIPLHCTHYIILKLFWCLLLGLDYKPLQGKDSIFLISVALMPSQSWELSKYQ